MDPKDWHTTTMYNTLYNYVHHLKVTNDVAERKVRLMVEYNGRLTHEDKIREHMIQEVEAHQKFYPNSLKSQLRR